MSTAQAKAKILRHAVKTAKTDARQDAYKGKYLPDSRHFAYDEARQAYADVYVVEFGKAIDGLAS